MLHDGDDPNMTGFLQVDDRVRKLRAEMSADWRIELAKTIRMRASRPGLTARSHDKKRAPNSGAMSA